jgi:N-acetylmuramic acid 6-phosphate etherase
VITKRVTVRMMIGARVIDWASLGNDASSPVMGTFTEVRGLQPTISGRVSVHMQPMRALEGKIVTLINAQDWEEEPVPAELESGGHALLAPLPVSSRTEERNWRTIDIDLVPTEEVLRLLNAEDARVAGAVASVLPDLAVVVDLVVERLRAGGQVHYFGAGTSGRIGVLDAAEVIPTFGLEPGVFVAHQAGGDRALGTAVEDAEDDEALGVSDARGVSAADVAVGITASGRTPYVAGALRSARAAGALTVLVSSNPAAPLAALADCRVLADTGPEAVAGSTRLKAATAQKMLLNALSTAAMVRLGRTYSNLMASVSGSNAKLRQRQLAILREATGAEDDEVCRAELERCGGDLRLALLCLLSGLEPKAAADALAVADGSVREAVARLGPAERA